MKNFIFALLAVCSMSPLMAQHHSFPYIDQNGLECVLTWNSSTGGSILYYYSGDDNKFLPSPYQLPFKPTGDAGVYQFHPYLDQNGLECVLAWNETTGKSKLYFYDSDLTAFAESPYQLPNNPTGDAGTYSFVPYLDQNGIECVLVLNMTTGNSKLYYYNTTSAQFDLAPYQLPKIR